MYKYLFFLDFFPDVADEEESFILGIYSTRRKAKKAKNRFVQRNRAAYSNLQFEISRGKIDQSGWLEGFINCQDALSAR